MDTLKGTIHIGRWSGGDEGRPVHIELTDEDSGCRAVTIEMSLAEFGDALTGRGMVPCRFEFNDSGMIGTLAQNKEEHVPVPAWSDRKDGWQKRALAPFEVDGWRARSGDIDNSHRSTKNKDGQPAQNVVFFRNVPKESK